MLVLLRLSFVVMGLDVIALGTIMQSTMPVVGKLLWAVIVLLLPVVGMLLYFAVGQKA
jgi:hypothetical protein